MKSLIALKLAVVCLLTYLSGLAMAQENWPQFRGVHAAGISEGSPPTTWNNQTGENIAWKTAIPGLAHSAPIVWGDRVFLTTALNENVDQSVPSGWSGGTGKAAEEVGDWTWQVLCLDRKTGDVLWTKDVAKGQPAIKRHLKATHANCTPATDGNYVVAFFGSEGLYCLDFDGNLVWKQDLGRLHSGPYNAEELEWGFASSPIIHGDKVIVQCDCLNTGFVSIRSLGTGEEVRRIEREDVATWSTPAVFETEVGTQLVCNGYKEMAGYDYESGEQLWTLHDGGDVPVPTPLFANGLIVLTSGHGKSPTYAIKPTATGDITPTNEAEEDLPKGLKWWQPQDGSYMPTPIIVGDLLYTCNDNGRLAVRDALSGELVYKKRVSTGRNTFSASAVATKDQVYFPAENGNVIVIKTGREYELIAKIEMGELLMSSPAIAGDQLFVRTMKNLYCIGTATEQDAAVDYKAELEKIAVLDQKVMMPMRDGTRLCTDIYRPKTDGKVPVIFSRTPYNFNGWRDGEESTRSYRRALEAVKRGYAYVVQNERGRYFSEGQWDILGTPTTDGYDAFSWMTKQAWCNGRIGTLGCSSTAEWQMAVAALDHPSHAAMVPQGYGAGVGRVGDFNEQGNWYRGGAEQMLFFSWLYGVQNDRIRPTFPADATQEELIRNSRFFDLAPERPKVDWVEANKHLPLQDIMKNVDGPIGIFEDMIRRKPNDSKWHQGGLYHDNMPFGVPSFWFVSWFDVASSPNIALFNHVREKGVDEYVRNNQYLIISPNTHCGFTRSTEETMVGDLNVGDARLNYDELIYDWFDAKLKQDKAAVDMPRVRYYTMGKNKWQTSEVWPPANTRMTPMYLSSEGKANTLNGDGTLSYETAGDNSTPDSFTYDPMNPVPSHGGNVCCTGGAIDAGSFDQTEMELREDILVYSTEPLKEGVEVSGFIESVLYVSSDAKDTDFTVKLIDVYPNGAAYNLDETIQRARFREGYGKEVLMEKGKVYELKLSSMSTSNYFAKGHRIRIEVSSSNFPRFARNLNTGGNNFDESKGVVAKNTIHHSDKYPSQIRLPIVEQSKQGQ